MTSDDNTTPPGRVQVRIFDRVYVLRAGGGDEGYVRRVARIVDERMQQVSELLTTSDVAKVAVLAALNIAGELEELRARYKQGARAAEAEGAGEPARPAAEVARDERRSWFEEIFDGEFAQKKNSDERLSSLVSSKLQRHRPPGGGGDPERAEPEGEN
ncbi:MAG TPA: cell division protein ZapA [Pyrinomonadaceae bacterium]|nr:cell division protein ZapA [Pyrinomonadaceae bacterium]